MSSRPLTLIGAAALQSVLGAVIAALGAGVLLSTLGGDEGDLASGVAAAAFAVGVGALLCYLAWGLFRLNEWARTPVVLTQIFALLSAGYLYQAGQGPAAGGLAVLAGAALALVLAPATTAALFPDESGRSAAG